MNEPLRQLTRVTGDAGQGPVLSMTSSKKIHYEIEHTRNSIFDLADETLSTAAADRPVLIVVDDSLWPTYGAAIDDYAHTHLNCVGLVRLSGTESTKSLDQLEALCGAAFDADLPRHGAFIAIGGGTILDSVGFAASIFRRGIAYLRVPTTLVGMIDVGVGIKQAINFRSKKNALGSFYPPLRTINDVRFLHTLSQRQLACGTAEALKMGLICDAKLFTLLEDHGPALVSNGYRDPEAIAIEVLLRAEVSMMQQLETNLFESELRRLVDFGHTFSPIIETSTSYEIAHGEAVGLDILLSTAIATARHLCNPDLVQRLKRLYLQIGLPTDHASMSPLLMERALLDTRAHRGGALNLVVPTGVGSGEFLQDVGYEELVCALELVTGSS